VRPHGLRGEVVVELVTNRLERLAHGSRLVALVGAGEGRTLEVEGSRPHKGRHLVRFTGVERAEEAEALRGARLLAEPIVDPEAMFVHELIGCEVRDASGRHVGVVSSVEANPASDLLVLDGGGLVPLRFVTGRHPGVLVVDVPDGLLE
jgi:16S rRNA processing protein RimM